MRDLSLPPLVVEPYNATSSLSGFMEQGHAPVEVERMKRRSSGDIIITPDGHQAIIFDKRARPSRGNSTFGSCGGADSLSSCLVLDAKLRHERATAAEADGPSHPFVPEPRPERPNAEVKGWLPRFPVTSNLIKLKLYVFESKSSPVMPHKPNHSNYLEPQRQITTKNGHPE